MCLNSPRLTLLLACSFLAAQHLSAARVNYVDTFGMARGGAFTATADNPSAVYYNPAGLSWLEGTQFQSNAFAVTLHYDFEGENGSDEIEREVHPVASFFVTHNFEDNPISVGVGVYVPWVLVTDWGRRADFNVFEPEFPLGFGLPYFIDVLNIRHQAVVAYQVTDTLSVGAGVSYDTTQIKAQTRAVDYKADDEMTGFSLSVMWRPNEKHSFGLTYQSETKAEFKGSSVYLGRDDGLLDFDSGSNFTFPDSITFGYSYRPNKKWNFEFNLDWTDWDDVDELELLGIELLGIEFPRPLRGYEVQWESSFMYKFGATRYFENGWSLTAGYQFVENAIPDESLLHIIPFSERHYLSFGVGRQTERWTFQFAYEFTYDPGRKVTDGEYNTNGEFKVNSHAIGLSASYRF